jgi:hypothetical protein
MVQNFPLFYKWFFQGIQLEAINFVVFNILLDFSSVEMILVSLVYTFIRKCSIGTLHYIWSFVIASSICNCSNIWLVYGGFSHARN